MLGVQTIAHIGLRVEGSGSSGSSKAIEWLYGDYVGVT